MNVVPVTLGLFNILLGALWLAQSKGRWEVVPGVLAVAGGVFVVVVGAIA